MGLGGRLLELNCYVQRYALLVKTPTLHTLTLSFSIFYVLLNASFLASLYSDFQIIRRILILFINYVFGCKPLHIAHEFRKNRRVQISLVDARA